MELMIKYTRQGVSANEILIRRKIQNPSPEELTKFNGRKSEFSYWHFVLFSFLISIKEFN